MGYKRRNRDQPQPIPRYVTLKNRLTNEIIQCIILNEEVIDDVVFFVVEANGRRAKLNKAAYDIIQRK